MSVEGSDLDCTMALICAHNYQRLGLMEIGFPGTGDGQDHPVAPKTRVSHVASGKMCREERIRSADMPLMFN